MPDDHRPQRREVERAVAVLTSGTTAPGRGCVAAAGPGCGRSRPYAAVRAWPAAMPLPTAVTGGAASNRGRHGRLRASSCSWVSSARATVVMLPWCPPTGRRGQPLPGRGRHVRSGSRAGDSGVAPGRPILAAVGIRPPPAWWCSPVGHGTVAPEAEAGRVRRHFGGAPRGRQPGLREQPQPPAAGFSHEGGTRPGERRVLAAPALSLGGGVGR